MCLYFYSFSRNLSCTNYDINIYDDYYLVVPKCQCKTRNKKSKDIMVDPFYSYYYIPLKSSNIPYVTHMKRISRLRNE